MDGVNPLQLFVLLAFSSVLSAVACEAATLADDSPFLPHGSAGSHGAATSAGALELRGIMSASSGDLYYVYDPVKKHGDWAGLNDAGASFAIIAGNASEGRVEIRMNDGRHLSLILQETKVLPDGMDREAPESLENAVVMPRRPRGNLTEVQVKWREELNRRLAENAANP
jgi:hypothetical protein